MSILFTVSNQAFGQVQNVTNASTEQIEVGLDSDTSKPMVKIDVQTVELDPSQNTNDKIADIVAAKSKIENSSVVFSTDNEQLLKTTSNKKSVVVENVTGISLTKEDATVEAPKTKFSQLVKSFFKTRAQYAMADKIGLMVLTYTTASETLVWIHSTHLSRFESTSNAVYTLILAVIFGLNKDTWAQTTRPIQKFFRNIIKPESASPTNGKEMATRFLGNLSLAVLVSGVRIPLITMDKIIEQGVHLNYFSMPLLLTLVSTAAAFTWSEHIAMIDEKSQGLTKFIFRRTNEIRSVVLATFATTAALLSPAQYGASPWITLAGVGMTGALVYINADAISKWIESRKSLQVLKPYLQSQNRSAVALSCQGLFAK